LENLLRKPADSVHVLREAPARVEITFHPRAGTRLGGWAPK